MRVDGAAGLAPSTPPPQRVRCGRHMACSCVKRGVLGRAQHGVGRSASDGWRMVQASGRSGDETVAMRSAAPARTRPNSPMRTHGSGGSLCGYACGRMRGRLDTHLGAGTASADARSEAPDPCRHAALSAVQHSPTRTRNARSTSCCAACSMLLAVACATACGTTQRWPPARADALRGRGKAARRAGGRRSGKRATAARGARGLHDPQNKKLITCIWVGVFETHCCCSAFFTPW